MLRILLLSAVLEACTPSPQESTVRSREPVVETATRNRSHAMSTDPSASLPAMPKPSIGGDTQAALAPVPQPVSAAANPAPALLHDKPAEAVGRRTLSTAFVMVGADGLLTVELRDGRVLILRDVVMRPTRYDGVLVSGAAAGGRYRGAYADIAAARPGGGSSSESDPAIANPGRARHIPSLPR
jgi:hypothetical protein